MNIIKNLFKGGRQKALTLSYYDGTVQDKRLVSIFNKYGLKATFNLNSGIQSEENYWINQGKKYKELILMKLEKCIKAMR